MFDLSFAECALAAIVGVALINPKHIPETIRTVRGWLNRLSEWKGKTAGEFRRVMDEIEGNPPASQQNNHAPPSYEDEHMLAHERFVGVDVSEFDVSRKEPSKAASPIEYTATESDGMLDQESSDALNALPTISAKIRFLNSKDLSCKEISAMLGKSYSHVHGVLQKDKAKKRAGSKPRIQGKSVS